MQDVLDDRTLRASLEILSDGFICIDAEHRITFFNGGAERLFGYAKAEVLGKPLNVLLPARFHSSHHRHVQSFAASGTPARLMGERREVYGIRKDGTEFPADASIAQVVVDGQSAYSVAIRDITERMRFEHENAVLVRDLRSAVAARDELLGIVSHDLRNPVNAVKMLAAAILRAVDGSGAPKVVSHHADVMLQAARQMDTLIQDLMDVTAIEAGQMAMNPRPESLADLVNAAIGVLRPAAEHAEVRVRAAIPADLPDVDVDPDRIIQVLSNVVGNAVKYTPAGGEVVVGARHEDDVVHVSVRDTGIGIPADDLPLVFDRFWQSKRTNRSGAGLGLTITRGLVRAHGGRIWIESPPGGGTVVHFTLPLASPGARTSDG